MEVTVHQHDGQDDHERVRWYDIELLPLYILGGMLLFVVAQYFGAASSALVRENGIKALAGIGLLGVHRLWRASAEQDSE
jgi:hypothetical protein